MKPLRWLGGALVWLVGGLVATLGVLLSVTIVLLPLGIPLLWLAWKLFGVSARLVLPRPVVHPVRELQRRATEAPSQAIASTRRRHRPTLRKRMKRRVRRIRKQLRTA